MLIPSIIRKCTTNDNGRYLSGLADFDVEEVGEWRLIKRFLQEP
jgi:hypothetical protein